MLRRHRPRCRRDRAPGPDRRARSRARGIEVVVYDGVHVEPTDASIAGAVAFARDVGPFDAFVAVGGGSAIDTAKAVNLLTTNPGELMDYINAPVGKRPGAGAPAAAAGRGADDDRHRQREHHDLRPRRALAPRQDRHQPPPAPADAGGRRPAAHPTQPAGVTAAAGMDILCHALESWTARPYTPTTRKTPEQRVPYCGANPVADMWAERSMPLLADAFRRAVRARGGREAREQMALAATFAGHGLRQRRGPHPARQRLPDRRAGQGLPAGGLPRRTSRWCRTAWRSP